MRNLVRVRVVRPRSLLVALTVCAAVAPATPASALDVGFDVSFPQCGGALPALGAFAMNLANPGPDVSTHWPRGQATHRECDMPPRPGADTADCAYDYGWNAASDAYATAVAAYVSLGLVAPGATATPAPVAWWLDVERANTWRTGASLNVAAIQGAVERLRSAGALLVGIYSSSADWQAITDAAVFPELPSWVAGPGTRAEAEASCVDDQGFTTGGVGMVQSPSEGFDANVRCPPDLAIASAPAAVSAGAPSRAIVARVRPVQPIPVQMTLSTGSRAPLLAPTPVGPWASVQTVTVPAGARDAPAIYLRGRRARVEVITIESPGSLGLRQPVKVTPGRIRSLRVSTRRTRLRLGASGWIRAIARDRFGNDNLQPPSWSGGRGVVSVSRGPRGVARLTGVRPGRGVITVRVGRLARRIRVTVVP